MLSRSRRTHHPLSRWATRHQGWLGGAPAGADDGGIDTILSRRRLDRRRAFIESYAFPVALEVKLRDYFDHDRDVQIALEGLREWYLACLDADGESLGMPSRVVDIAWHEMILMTRTYHAYCERAFGAYLHHSPEALMDEPLQSRSTVSKTGSSSNVVPISSSTWPAAASRSRASARSCSS